MRVPGHEEEDQAAAEQAERNDEEQDRRLHELIQELRLLLPATTVLFGFLLSVPFSSRFDSLSSTDRVVHFGAFVSSALALVFLLAEAGYHQLRGKPYDKDVMIRTTSRQAVMGLALLGSSLLACVAFVADLVYGGHVALAVSVPVALGATGMWFVLPLRRRFRGDPAPTRTSRAPEALGGVHREP